MARARLVARAAGLWTAAVVVVLLVLLWTDAVRGPVEGDVLPRALAVPLGTGLLLALLIGGLLAVRWARAGLLLLSAAGAVVAQLAFVQHRPVVGAVVAVAVLAPVLVLGLSWQRNARPGPAVRLAVGVGVALTVASAATDRAWSAWFGPTHPSSRAPAPSRGLVDWAWAGGVSDSGFSVRARTREPASDVRLLVARIDAQDATVAVRATAVPSDPQVVAASVSGLDAGTEHTWALEVDGRTDPARTGLLRTVPRGPASFTFAVGACALTGSNGAVFDAVRELDPLFLAVLGDYHYANVDTDDVARFGDAFAASLRTPAQAALFARVPVAYVWDDHDYSGDEADRTAPSRPAALRAYRDHVPHHPLRLGDDGPIFQAFTVGRVRVVMTDGRSARTPASVPDGPGKSMLGERQRAALLAELRAADRWAAVVWVNPVPWVEAEAPGADGWGGYATERRLLADAIADAGVDNLVMVSGDAHMLALDDGSGTGFSSSGADGFPLLHAAALDRRGEVKGGPYSGPVLPGGGQFGTVEVRDDGRRVDVVLRGHDWRGAELVRLEVDLAE